MTTAQETRRSLQLIELEILEDFQKLCQAHDLTFFITAGTLLGAVRHGGFIPWDDDIDVVMPRSDFDRLSEICRTRMPNGYFFQNCKTDPNYPFFFAKLRKNGTHVEEVSLSKVEMNKGIYLDIFPLDICPRGERGGRLYFKWVEQLQCAVMARVNPDFICGYSKGYMRGLHKLLRHLPLSALRGLWRLTHELLQGVCSNGRLSTACAAHGYPYEVYAHEWFSAAVPMCFEGMELPAPVGWRELLENMYGDYMTLPPESERLGHFVE